jgi:hypothetical protein
VIEGSDNFAIALIFHISYFQLRFRDLQDIEYVQSNILTWAQIKRFVEHERWKSCIFGAYQNQFWVRTSLHRNQLYIAAPRPSSKLTSKILWACLDRPANAWTFWSVAKIAESHTITVYARHKMSTPSAAAIRTVAGKRG